MDLFIIEHHLDAGRSALDYALRRPPRPLLVADYRATASRILPRDAVDLLDPALTAWVDLTDIKRPARILDVGPDEHSAQRFGRLLGRWAAVLRAPLVAGDATTATAFVARLTAGLGDGRGRLPLAELRSLLGNDEICRQLWPTSRSAHLARARVLGILDRAFGWAHVAAIAGAPSAAPAVECPDPSIVWMELSPAHLEPTEHALLSAALHAVVERCAAPPPGVDSGARRAALLLFPPAEDRTGHSWPDPSVCRPLVVALRTHPSEAPPALLTALRSAGRRLQVEVRPPEDRARRRRWANLASPLDAEELLSRPDVTGRVAVRFDGETAKRAVSTTRPPSVLSQPPPQVTDALRWRSHHDRKLAPWARAAVSAASGLGADRDPWDRLCDPVTLRLAWAALRSGGTGSAAGVDGIRPHAFSLRLEAEIDALVRDLRDGSYAPLPLRWFTVPKPSGGERRIGVSAVRDRLVQRAWLSLAEPWFEPAFSDHSFAFRPHRGAHHAVVHILAAAARGLRHAVRLDVRACFDTIPHDLVVSRVAARLPSPRLLGLLGRWLRSGLAASTDLVGLGVAQGSIVSPFLSNVVLDDLDHALEAAGVEHARYADDLFLLCRGEPQGREAEALAASTLRDLGLELNDAKRLSCPLAEGVCFLGFRLLGPGTFEADPERLRDAAGRVCSAITALPSLPEAGIDAAVRRIGRQVEGIAAYWCHLGITPGLATQMESLLARLHDEIRSLPTEIGARPAWGALPDLATLVSRFGLFTAGAAAALGGGTPHGHGPSGERPASLLESWPPPPGSGAQPAPQVGENPPGGGVQAAPGDSERPTVTAPRDSEPPVRLDQRIHTVQADSVRLRVQDESLSIRFGRSEAWTGRISGLDVVLIQGWGTSLGGHALLSLAERGVGMIVASPAGSSMAVMATASAEGHKVRAAQARAFAGDEGLRIGAAMLRAKVSNQATLLRYLARSPGGRAGPDRSTLSEAAPSILAAADRIVAELERGREEDPARRSARLMDSSPGRGSASRRPRRRAHLPASPVSLVTAHTR